MNRRDAIRIGATAGLAAAAGVAMAQAPPKPLRVGVIGVGGRGTYLLNLALAAGVEVPAVCDIREAHLNRALDLVAKARGRKPEGYSKGPFDYRRMIQRDDLDAVIVATPMQVHAAMSIDALRAGKHVLSEVAAAMTVDECWGLVRAAEETGRIYMLAENCCYWQPVMMILAMVRKGIFGDLTYAECGYVHDCRTLMFEGDQLTWRGEMLRDYLGNLYPTHALGPVAQWLGINRGDRFVSLVASATGQKNLVDFVRRKFPKGHPAHEIKFRSTDSATTLIRTAKGALVDLRYDISSPRPVVSTTYYSLQGTRASFESRGDTIWIDGRSAGHAWEPAAKYANEFEHPMWTQWRQQAAGAGHGGGDFFVIHEFLQTIRAGRPSPIDACDAAAWSCVIELSGRSIAAGGAPQEVPDFTKGKWENRAP
ncbi:MAG: Gfo/Idh/MocA family oxidoreductase [Thermoguttaceae bacterium]|jgi:predicted dehydrogenase|nr:Gfo/Idh/MocA family oxidoreductase [Thermoguttaceae bacterium]